MGYFLSFIIILISVSYSFGATFTYENPGLWTNQSNWDIYPGTTISANDSVIIQADLTLNQSVTINGHLSIEDSFTFSAESVITINGTIVNDGVFDGTSQINLFGEGTNHGTWELEGNGTLIITGAASFTSNGTFTNTGTILGYNGSELNINGNFTNNDYMTINSTVNFNLEEGEEFTCNDFAQFNGPVRLEGKMIIGTEATFNINNSAQLTIADNSHLNNSGTLNILGTCHLSSIIDNDSSLGFIKVTGNLLVKPNIPEIL